MLKKGDDVGIVEVEIPDMIADLDARVARCAAAAIELGAGGICALSGDLGEGEDSPGCWRADLEGEVVKEAAHLDRLVGGVRVVEEDRGGRRHPQPQPRPHGDRSGLAR